jgi:2-C-methyl-D-erythritol 4-phosphate cytidylyltransferase
MLIRHVILSSRILPTVVFYALNAFEKNPNIEKIVIVTRVEEIAGFRKLFKKYDLKKVVAVIAGGKERQDSAYNALKYLEKEIGKKRKTIVIFHNGANPFVTQEEINQSIKMAKKHGACVVAHPTRDTVKEVDKKGLVARTLERKKLWNMQTPQAIHFELALQAFKKLAKIISLELMMFPWWSGWGKKSR